MINATTLHMLINPNDSVERQRDKLLKITSALMKRVEQVATDQDAGYAHFQRAVMLEEQVRARTRDLEKTLDLLNLANSQLAEATQRAEQARADLSSAIETIQEGFGLFDANETLIMCNSRFGQHMPDIRSHLQPGLQFADYVRLVSRSRHLSLPLEETEASWVAQRLEKHRDDYVVFNVQLIWDRWLQVSEHRTAEGGTVIVHTDVTDMMRLERRERERMLDDQARIIRATLDHINQGVCIFDRDKLLVGWNRRVSSLLALPAGRLVFGTSFDRLFALMEDRVKFSDPVAADRMRDWVNHTGPRPALTFEIQRGSNVILDVFAAETPDRGFVVSFTDVTAEREAVRAMVDANESLEQRVMDRTLALEDALADAERANASKSRFVAAASHDLLQPLSAAKLFLSSLESGGASPSDVADTVKRATNALGSVETILGSLLDISKLDAGLAAMEPGPVPLGLVMRTLAEEFTPLAAKKGLRLRIIPCNVTVTSDAAYLRRILQNLIANAIRYTDQGRVIIGARRLKGQVRVEIWDTGAGIPPDEQQKIFGEFHRVGATSSAGEGMGLGLAIVDRACTLLGHNLSLWSELGRGSGFFVTFDLADCAGSSLPKPRIDGPRLTAEALENVLVLLIENDHELRIAMCRQLEAWGLSVLDVPGIQSAQELLEEVDITPDLVICDYQLDDGTTGLDALDQLTPKIGKVPAIMVTANRSQDLRAEVKRRGLDLLHKPLDPAQLHARICELMTEPVRLTG